MSKIEIVSPASFKEFILTPCKATELKITNNFAKKYKLLLPFLEDFLDWIKKMPENIFLCKKEISNKVEKNNFLYINCAICSQFNYKVIYGSTEYHIYHFKDHFDKGKEDCKKKGLKPTLENIIRSAKVVEIERRMHYKTP